MIIIDGKKVAEELLKELKVKIQSTGDKPVLNILQVGSNPASNIYVKRKLMVADQIGINANLFKFDDNIDEGKLLETINSLNKKRGGIILQLPVSQNIDTFNVINAIDYRNDVDGLTCMNQGKLFSGRPYIISCTPLGVLKLLKYYNIEISGKNVVILGRSLLVGRPLSQLLINENATVTVIHSFSKNIQSITKNADILISAIGKPNFIDDSFIKEWAVVIDVGISKIDGKIVGDVNFDKLKDKASFITPVPGGVGPMTVACLMYNTFTLTHTNTI